MKTAVWVVVYFAMCFLLFTGWMFAFAQYAPYNGQEHAFSLTYLLNLFFLHVVMVPYYEFFQTEAYSNALMSLADESGKTGNKPPENPPETSLINVNYVAWLCRKMNGTESEGKQTAKA
ncbi:hypothetical protein [Klebsiella variicola]|uniref:hypothetical protein n=1 Tax=Klebsiella variicola TaxID=244366 RepID=UPI000671E875|nr:hypothetical protein [Klebsiella variicola]CTQ16726.1 exported hypothetical protein [Klebsiella variicola]SXE22181.1 Uncharacterised protein [Klebsiella variicola]VEC94923.1 Uncharacterised protein [Klebsiella variicola]